MLTPADVPQFLPPLQLASSDTLIEGIETAEQAAQLIKLGCVLGRGYYYSRPVDRHAITELLLHDSEKPDLLGQLSPPVKTAIGWR